MLFLLLQRHVLRHPSQRSWRLLVVDQVVGSLAVHQHREYNQIACSATNDEGGWEQSLQNETIFIRHSRDNADSAGLVVLYVGVETLSSVALLGSDEVTTGSPRDPPPPAC